LILALVILLFGIPWALSLLLAGPHRETAEQTIFLFLPLLTLIGLYWIRWWALRPPRVWADLTGE